MALLNDVRGKTIFRTPVLLWSHLIGLKTISLSLAEMKKGQYHPLNIDSVKSGPRKDFECKEIPQHLKDLTLMQPKYKSNEKLEIANLLSKFKDVFSKK